jgi:AcrR family transcriptional regulator
VPRPELHTTDSILDAARTLVLDGGARAATLDGIVAMSGAPKGSIYHRFATLNDLLAAMWIRAIKRSQQEVTSATRQGGDPVDAAVAGGLAFYEFAESNRADARLLVAFRREDLIGSVKDPELLEALRTLNSPLPDWLAGLARRLYGRASRSAVERTALAVIDLPLGAIRRHLVAGSAFPPALRTQLEAAIRAALDATREPGR